MPPKKSATPVTKMVTLSPSQLAIIVGKFPTYFPENCRILRDRTHTDTFNNNTESYPVDEAIKGLTGSQSLSLKLRNKYIQCIKNAFGLEENVAAATTASSRSNGSNHSPSRTSASKASAFNHSTSGAMNLGPLNCLTEAQALAMNGLANVRASRVCNSANARAQPSGISCLFLGHGITITSEYIVLPDNVGLTFYTEKGQPLLVNASGHSLLKNFNSSSSITPNPSHFIEPNSLMYNMSIKFLSFFQPNSNGTHGNYTHYERISRFGYSGIVTKRRGDFKSIFELTNSNLTTNNITGINISRQFDLRDIRPEYYHSLRGRLDLLHNKSNKNTDENEEYNHLFKMFTSKYKIISFGDNIFGLIGNNNSVIDIINTLKSDPITLLSGHSIPSLKTELLTFIESRRDIQPTPISSYPNIISMEAFKKMKCLSLIHHNQEIIRLDGNNTSHHHFIHNLGHVLSAIDVYNSGRGHSQKIRLCHGVVCRSYNRNISTNLMPNPNSAGASSSSSVNLSSPLQLIRTKSATPFYRRTFSDIWTRGDAAVNSILNNSNIGPELYKKINDYYSKIIRIYNEDKYLNDNDYLFIMYLINDDQCKTKVRKLISHIKIHTHRR